MIKQITEQEEQVFLAHVEAFFDLFHDPHDRIIVPIFMMSDEEKIAFDRKIKSNNFILDRNCTQH